LPGAPTVFRCGSPSGVCGGLARGLRSVRSPRPAAGASGDTLLGHHLADPHNDRVRRAGAASRGHPVAGPASAASASPIILLLYLFDDDGAIRYQGRKRADGSPHRQEQCADHAPGEWDLDQVFAFLIPDGDAADVALMHQLFHFGDQLITVDLILLCPDVFLAHTLFPFLIRVGGPAA